MKRLKNRRYITLLELLIVFALLSVAAGAAAYNIRGFFRNQNRLAEMDRLVENIRDAQNAMMLLNIDSEIKITKEPSGLFVQWIPKSPLSNATNKLFKPKQPFTYITEVSFEDAITGTELKDNLSLVFLSKGFLMNRGILTLKSDQETRFLLMPGYPWPFHLVSTRPDLPPFNEIEDIIRQITDITLQETL